MNSYGEVLLNIHACHVQKALPKALTASAKQSYSLGGTVGLSSCQVYVTPSSSYLQGGLICGRCILNFVCVEGREELWGRAVHT